MMRRIRAWLIRAAYYGGLAALAYLALVGDKAWAGNLLPFALVVSLLLDAFMIVVIVAISAEQFAALRDGGVKAPRLGPTVAFYLLLAFALAAAGWFVTACVALLFVVTAVVARGAWDAKAKELTPTPEAPHA